MTNDKGQNGESAIEGWRINAFLILGIVIFVVFAARLFTVQILQRDQWTSEATVNRTEEISSTTRRGVIYDRNGIILASNIAAYNVAITPALLPDDPGEIDEIFRQISNLTGVPLNKGTLNDPLIQCGDNLGITQMVTIGETFAPYQPVLVKCDIERDIALTIQEKAIQWPGVSIEIDAVRDYPTGELTSTIIGFLGPIFPAVEEEMRSLGFVPGRDKVGYAGVELTFENLLRGLPGKRVVEVDVAGQVLRDLEPPVPPTPGLNLVLTLDTRLQQAAEAILTNEIDGWNRYFGEIRITSGVAIAMNPKTGEILAMVSYPSYENNRMARVIPSYYYQQLTLDATQPLLNHAIGAELPAGSVFKLVTSVGVLNEGVVTPDQIVQTPPQITVTEKFISNNPGSSRVLVDWNEAGFGSLDFIGGLSNSSNVYFYKVGGGWEPEGIEGLGICRLGTYARAMGFGSPLGIELPYEADGLVPSPTWKRITQGQNWSTGDTYISSVGQGFVIATPLQILNSAATIANGGVIIRPTIIRQVVDGAGNVVPVVMDVNGNIYDVPFDENGNVLEPVLDEDGNEINVFVASPFFPDVLRDLTKDPYIEEVQVPNGLEGGCKDVLDANGQPVLKTVQPWVFQTIQAGMRRAVTHGTLKKPFEGITVTAAGKTGTAEYCDAVALSKNRCQYGNWPSHAWTVAYAPYDNPEIAVIAFLYNGEEGSSVAAPVVRKILEAYFELKAIDAALGKS